MSEQFTKPYEAQASYGSSAVNNRVRPGGSLGSNQYYYTTNAKTGAFLIKAVDKLGNSSAAESIVYTNISGLQAYSNVATYSE